ncbi:hypothetical protein TNCV_16881 [Trichonephila clavipes]|nr:hypothetical protein TNCV_16881 [Trichonephila clavipes]
MKTDKKNRIFQERIKYMQRSSYPTNCKAFLKIDTDSERRMEFQKELRSCMSGYRDIYKQLTTDLRRKNLSLTLWCK